MNIGIPQSEKERQALVDLGKKRYRIATKAMTPKHEIWTRCYKIYRALADAVDDPDEPNLFIPYAFAIVEDIVSRITEPILQRLPIRVRARRSWHVEAARKFYDICKTYFSTSRYQSEYVESTREMVITGNAWERDEWANEWLEGKEWAKTPKTKFIESMKSLLGKVVPISSTVKYEATEEVPRLYPESVGYRTRFPSVFHVFPEPKIKRVEDMHWIVEEEEEVAVEDLKKQRFMDPVTKEMKSVYDLSEMEKDKGPHDPGSIKPIFEGKSTYGPELKNILSGGAGDSDSQEYDMDKVHLIHIYEPRRIFTIAQGKYVVRVVTDHSHVPKIPMRLKLYTPDKENLFAIGAIEPCEHMFYELNDIHRLSMRSWIRIISNMIAYHKDAIPFPDDFKPAAGGRIRVDPSVNVHDAIMSIPQDDPTRSMLAQESNIKGLLERVISIADLSPGVEGTKQYHKTATGLLEIQNALAKRFATMRRIQLANYQSQMGSMYRMHEQFMFDKMPFTGYDKDSQTSYVEYSRDDIYTKGEGFEFFIEDDPSFGDDVVQRNQQMIMFDSAMKYETFRLNSKDPKLEKVNIGKLFKRILKSFGYTHTNEVMEPPEGVLNPESEFEMIMAEIPVQSNPEENLVGHAIAHLLQKSSPRVKEGFEKGKISPESMALLDEHIAMTMQMIQAFMTNPLAIVQAKHKQKFEGTAIAGTPEGGMPAFAPTVMAGDRGGAITGGPVTASVEAMR